MKFVFPAIWIPVFGFGVVMMFLGGIKSGDFLVKRRAGKVAWFKDPDGNILSVSEH